MSGQREAVRLAGDVPGVVARRSFLSLMGAGAATLPLIAGPGEPGMDRWLGPNEVGPMGPEWVFEEPPVVLDQDPERVLLDQNENPLTPSETQREALIEALNLANRYPDDGQRLASHLSDQHGVESRNILTGCGSTELLKVCADATMGPGRELVQGVPTYPTIERYARVRGGEIRSVPVAASGSLDLDGMAAQINRRTAAVYVCNPNNPTGGVLRRDELRAFVDAVPEDVLICVDEAYHDYVDAAGYASFIPLAVRRPNLVVLRTFSKVYGLAGMRIGYGIAAEPTVERLAPHVLSINLNNPGIFASIASLQDTDLYEKTVRMNRESRDAIVAEMPRFGGRPVPSQGGFVWVDFGRPTAPIRRGLADEHVYIRTYGHSPNHIRISTGTPRDMERLFAAMEKVAGSGA